MIPLVVLFVACGLVPCVVGLALLRADGGRRAPTRSIVAATVLCALCFDLTFLWQELWLVIPKSLAPGLHPVLFHNDHDWTGTSPWTELLQGSGALATLVVGLAFVAIPGRPRPAGPTWRRFCFWMAFQGLFQPLAQVALGTLLPANDVGRALVFLGAGWPARASLLVADVVAMATAGIVLARRGAAWGGFTGTRADAWTVLLPAVAAIPLVVPFRLPRDVVEVAFVPALVHAVGAGWLLVGSAMSTRYGARRDAGAQPRIDGPVVASLVLLVFVQVVLRPGIRFG